MVRVPMGRFKDVQSKPYAGLLLMVFASCIPFQVSANGLLGEKSAPANNREISEASATRASAASVRNTRTRSNVSSEAASPNTASPRIQARTASVPTPQAATQRISNSANTPVKEKPASVQPSVSSANNAQKAKTSNVSLATEAEMALALDLPLEVKSASDVRFATNDMRPMDVAPWQKIGSPYQVNGVWYIPAHEPNYDEIGEASWYGSQFNGRPTANGEIFDMNVVTVAHPTLPIPSLVEVINLENGRSIVARVNDRGPFANNRLIDVSQRGAELLGFKDKGKARVRVRYVGQAPQQTINANNSRPNTTISAATNAQTATNNRTTSPIVEAAKPVNVQPNTASNGVLAATTDNQGGAYVQIGAFSSLANAERALDQNSSFGPGKIVPVHNGSTSVYRVLIGPFDATDAALKAQEAKSNGISGARVLANIS